MARPCLTCNSPNAKEIDRKLRARIPADDVRRWLEEIGNPISTQALLDHRRNHLKAIVPRGRTAAPDDLAERVVARVAERMEEGDLEPTITDGLKAVGLIDARKSRGEFANLARLAMMALTGQIVPDAIEGEYTELPDEDEQELQRLLTAGG